MDDNPPSTRAAAIHRSLSKTGHMHKDWRRPQKLFPRRKPPSHPIPHGWLLALVRGLGEETSPFMAKRPRTLLSRENYDPERIGE